MKGLLKIIPPLAPDYAGSSSVLYTLGGAIIINGADGCIGNVTGYDEPRFFDYKTHIYSSGLREYKAITGDEEILKDKINNSVGDKDINFITILGTPNSAVIASDHKGVANIIRRGKNVPVFTISTTGIETYEKGASNAYLELAKNFIREVPKTGGINIIGASPMDLWDHRQIEAIKESLEKRGLTINGIWGYDDKIESVKNTLASDVNLVVSWSGLKLARHLKNKYKMPFVTGVPIGTTESDRIARALKEAVSGNSEEIESSPKTENAQNTGPAKYGKTILIIGDQIWTNSLRNCLAAEYGATKISTATFFSLDAKLKTENDYLIESERHIKQLIKDLNPDTVIGDPLCEGFISKTEKEDSPRFIGVPHPAVSSRMHWNHDVIYAGEQPNFL